MRQSQKSYWNLYKFEVKQNYKPFLVWNPISPLVETFRYAFTGTGYFTWFSFAYSFLFMCISLIIGVFIFNKTEKTFMDTV